MIAGEVRACRSGPVPFVGLGVRSFVPALQRGPGARQRDKPGHRAHEHSDRGILA